MTFYLQIMKKIFTPFLIDQSNLADDVFYHNYLSFFLSPNICPAALFEQGEEEETKNNVMLQPHNGRHLDFDFVY